MKEVTVRAWCDACAAEIVESGGDVEPATDEVVITIGRGGRARALDLCERHGKALVEPLAALLLDAGQDVPATPQTPATRPGRPGAKPARGTPYLCLWCPENYGSRTGLATHAREVHGFRDGSIVGTFGLTCPVCKRTMPSASAIGVHSRVHGAPNATDLYRIAAAAGDPHGIVARRLKAGKNVTPR